MADMKKYQTLQGILENFSPNIPLGKLSMLSTKWRALGDQERALPGAKPLKVAVLANFSTQFLVAGLELALAQRSFLVDVYEGGYNQWEIELLNPDSGLAEFHPDIVVVSLTTMLLALRNAHESAATIADNLAKIVEQSRERSGAKFVVTLPEPLEEEMYGTFWSVAWRREFYTVLRDRLAEQCTLLDLEPLIRRVGAKDWFAGRFYVAQKIIAHPNVTGSIADYFAQHIASATASPVRLVAVDLDNTLWGGVVGELGWDGVDLNVEGAGFGHLKLQRFLLDMHEKGVLLVALSKNNFQDALAVFENRPEMILKLEHFVDVKINWEPKTVNLRQSLKDLNLTAVGVAFIDDSPVERDEARYVFPEMCVPEFPDDMVDLVPGLVANGQFLIARTTREDKDRQGFYRVERDRLSRKQSAGDLSEFYASLELCIHPHAITADNINRVLDLIGKTNQFNLTSRRHSASAVEKMLATPGVVATAHKLTDRFGDYGLVGLILGVPEDAMVLVIDTWLLSCRAMGRTVENAMFSYLVDQAAAAGYMTIKGVYRPSEKNAPVADLFPRLGFVRTDKATHDGEALYTYDVSANPPKNKFVTIN